MRIRAVLIVLAGLVGSASAQEQRAYVARVEAEPYFLGLARVKVFASLYKIASSELIEGFKPEELVLVANNRQLKYPPGILRFSYTGQPADIVLVLQVTRSYTEALELLEEPLTKMLKDFGKAARGSRVAIITYGGEIQVATAPSFVSPDQAARAISRKVVADDEPQPPKLCDAVEKAKRLLQSSKASRRLIIVVGDGRNEDNLGYEPKLARNSKLPTDLANAGIPVHTLAYDPSGRRPRSTPYMVNLGQLSRLTHGFPRLAKDPESVASRVESLGAELKSQMVLTYFVPRDEVAGKKIKLLCKSAKCGYEKGESKPLESNEVKGVSLRCGEVECAGSDVCVSGACIAQTGQTPGLGIGVWLAIIGFIGGGAGATVAIILRRKKKDEQAAAVAAAPVAPQIVVPALPDFSNMPYLKNYKIDLPPGVVAAGAVPPPPVASPVAARVSSLLVMSGPRAGQQWPLRHGFTIGKAPGSDLVIDDGFASGRHAQIHIDTAGGAMLVDLGSTNGTFVNGVRVTNTRLTHGTSIRIGQTEMRFLQG